jgi:hypothetical protein
MKMNTNSSFSKPRRVALKKNSKSYKNDLKLNGSNKSKVKIELQQIENIYNSFWERWIFKTFFGLSKYYWDENKYLWYKNYLELSKSNIFEYFFR